MRCVACLGLLRFALIHLLIVCLEIAILLLLLGFVDGFERRQVFYFVPRKVLGGVCFGFVMR